MSTPPSPAGEGRPAPANAGGRPITEAVAHQAADWLTLLMSGETSDEDRARWQQWRDADPDHERAWRHVEAAAGRLRSLPPSVARGAPGAIGGAAPAVRGRRRALTLAAWAGVAVVAGGLASRSETWQAMVADLHTATGAQSTERLADGTLVTLNTSSAIDVGLDAGGWLLHLVSGEVMVSRDAAIGRAPRARGLVVLTAEGSIHPFGTRLSVRQLEGRTRIAVLEGEAEIRPLGATAQPRPLSVRAGLATSFTRRSVGPLATIDEQAVAWSRGQLVADNMRLDEFLADLSRYRPGVVRWAPAVAGLRVSGVFPLHDTDQVLKALAQVLPLEIRYHTDYWVQVEPAGG